MTDDRRPPLLKFRQAVNIWRQAKCGKSQSGGEVHVFTGEPKLGQRCHCGEHTTTAEDLRLANE